MENLVLAYILYISLQLKGKSQSCKSSSVLIIIKMYKLFIVCKILLLKSLQEQEDNSTIEDRIIVF